MHMENALTTANFSDFFVKIIAYLASHCRAKPHYFPTKATIWKILCKFSKHTKAFEEVVAIKKAD